MVTPEVYKCVTVHENMFCFSYKCKMMLFIRGKKYVQGITSGNTFCENKHVNANIKCMQVSMNEGIISKHLRIDVMQILNFFTL